RDLLTVVGYVARRYRGWGERVGDVVQVASVGLIKAVDGYAPARGVPFASYAVPTIVGELKRHFRDKGWSLRVRRRMQELRQEIGRATDELTHRLGRSPTVADLAHQLGIGEEDVLAGLECGQAYSTLSLSSPLPGDESGAELSDLIGD